MFPSDDGSTVFSDKNPKLKAKLEKEIASGKIKPDPIEDEKAVDGDNDSHIDKYVREVWSYYDRKNQGQIEKRMALQFFKVNISNKNKKKQNRKTLKELTQVKVSPNTINLLIGLNFSIFQFCCHFETFFDSIYHTYTTSSIFLFLKHLFLYNRTVSNCTLYEKEWNQKMSWQKV